VSARAGTAAHDTPSRSIRLRNLRKSFGPREALRGIDLDLEGAQVVGVVGPDGAGKTTLLRSLAGLLEISADEASVIGFDLRGDVVPLKARIGYVPQSFGLQRDLSVMENLRFTARLHRLSEAELQRRAMPVLERTGLAPFVHRPAGALSGGMKQKLAVTNALLPDPVLLVLDEPTAGVDVVARDEIRALLEERRAKSLVILSTSYLDEAEACDRLVYLDEGRVVASDTPAALRARVPLALYRAWGDDARGLARAARTLSYVSSARAVGGFARIESAHAPGTERLTADLRSLRPELRLIEAVPIDTESMLLHLSRADASTPR
jgi:ABC-2 type transport system ATP-binding protein